ncbi:DUF1189 domain-containing protein [Metabacillus malikii]|uniref:DUF1189 domain-containing protein n=1 Tax=Metabacillus malikii TaxID=1504265 RepID=A0ABT9ZH57_9BACI|nr:DUF1189 domain-containing protein [Metabacillus malikii]MDQ0231628.1 hypothetical protein [Metabacillus malikii]
MNVFKQFFTSIYSPKIISTFRSQGIGKTILFVFILSLLSILPSAIHFSNAMVVGLKGLDQTLKNELPAFSIENSKLHADINEPIEIKKDDFIIILDDTGSFGVEEIEAKNDAIGILDDRFVVSTAGRSQSYEYSLFNLSLTKDDIITITEQLNQILPIMLAIVIVILYLVGSFFKFIEVTFLALFGSAFNNGLQRNLSFKQVWILSAYSTTLATVFFVIMDSFQIIVPNGFLLTWFVHLVVIFLVMKEIPASKKPLSVS